MAKKKDTMTNIADLLPEGLDEKTLEKVAALIQSKIQEEVKAQVEGLTMKVTSFVRGKIDVLKEQAVKELELENQTFRDAELFKTMKSMFALENTGEDEINGFNALAEISESQEKKLETLVSEVDRLLRENVQLKRNVKLMTEQNTQLKKNVANLNENVKLASKTQTRKMSDRAVVVSSDTFKKVEEAKTEQRKAVVPNGNEFLTEEVIKAATALKKLAG